MTGKKNARIYAWVAATLFAVLSIYRVYSFYLTVKDDTFDVATDVVHLLSNLILIGLAVTLFIAKREAVAAVFSLRALCGAWTLFGSVRYFVQMLRYSFPKEYMVFPYGTTVVSDVLSLAISVLIVLLLLMPGRDGRKKAAALWFLPFAVQVLRSVAYFIMAYIGLKFFPKPDPWNLVDVLEGLAYLFIGLWIRQMYQSESEKDPSYRPGQAPYPQGWNPAPAAASSQNWNPAQGPAYNQGWNQPQAPAPSQNWNPAQGPAQNQGWNQPQATAYNQGWNQSQAPAPSQNWNPAPVAAPMQNQAPAPSRDISNDDKLRILKDLADSGVITQEEFETRKKMLGI